MVCFIFKEISEHHRKILSRAEPPSWSSVSAEPRQTGSPAGPGPGQRVAAPIKNNIMGGKIQKK